MEGLTGESQRVSKECVSGRILESSVTAGDSPVRDNALPLVRYLSTTGHANPVGSWGVHSPRLNTFGDR